MIAVALLLGLGVVAAAVAACLVPDPSDEDVDLQQRAWLVLHDAAEVGMASHAGVRVYRRGRGLWLESIATERRRAFGSDYPFTNAPALALAGLLHDTSEAYVGDLSYPMQLALGREARAAIRDLHERVWQILVDERDALLGPASMPWDVDDTGPLGVKIQAWGPAQAREEWLIRFERLMAETAR